MSAPTGHARLAGLVALTVLMAGAQSACTAQADRPTGTATISIGLLAARSGPDAVTGADALRGAQLAVDVINKSTPGLDLPLAAGAGLPALGGAKVDIVPADTGGDAATIGSITTDLVGKRKVAAIIAADSASAVAAASAQTEHLGIPLIDGCTSDDYLTELGQDWYFRIGPSDQMLIQETFDLLHLQEMAHARVGRIAVVQDGGGDTATEVSAIRDLADSSGYAISTTVAIGQQASPAQLASRIVGSGADVVLAVASRDASAGQMAKVAAQLPASTPMIGLGDGFYPVTAPASVSANSRGALLRVAPWSAEYAGRSPLAKVVADMYRKRFGSDLTVDAASGFTSMMVVAMALNSAGSSNPPDLRAALRRLWLPATQMIMPWNGVQFGDDGQNTLAAGIIEEQTAGGFQVVYPRELSSGRLAWGGSEGSG